MARGVHTVDGIIADAKQTLLAALKHPGPRPSENRAAWIAEQHAKQKDFCTPKDRPTPKVSMERVMKDVKSAMPADAITTTDAGSFGQWPQRYIVYMAVTALKCGVVYSTS